jgi:hypothetical protein
MCVNVIGSEVGSMLTVLDNVDGPTIGTARGDH